MLYIHQSFCISPQQADDLDTLRPSRDNQLFVLDPPYPDIPPGLLRRMGKAVKISVGAALPLLKSQAVPDGIIMGTGNGGLEDCIRFLDQIIQYDEGMLTPANFVQSTANAMASQISLLSRNHAYNITHVHRGLAFEQALLDAWMLAEEHPAKTFLLGGADEISSYNNNIETLSGSFKMESTENAHLYDSTTPGSLAGEGAALFRVGGQPAAQTAPDAQTARQTAPDTQTAPQPAPAANARDTAPIAVKALDTLHTRDSSVVRARLADFVARHGVPDLLLTGENGDSRLTSFYTAAEETLGVPVARFKHMTGEYPTAGAAGLWLAEGILRSGRMPAHMTKSGGTKGLRSILLYNTFKGLQHSFILVLRII